METLELSKNTIQTFSVDTFYLWKNVGQKEFWDVVTSNNFEIEARDALQKALMDNSSGNIAALLNGYLANLRKFRN